MLVLEVDLKAKLTHTVPPLKKKDEGALRPPNQTNQTKIKEASEFALFALL
jgi:hypothetical protein